MQTNKKIKTVSLDSMIDKHIGKIGTTGRDAFEHELKLDLLGNALNCDAAVLPLSHFLINQV